MLCGEAGLIQPFVRSVPHATKGHAKETSITPPTVPSPSSCKFRGHIANMGIRSRNKSFLKIKNLNMKTQD
ncbi:hypothetical protein XELAEV_18025214mg [Xenopus laevis]|uniref:Uncharacterized protein n=1 Tax=Xenopus laevis TaxID=8355 RepID=A0A974HLN3_XENLA|nr:hypothetical protein XELAEV_18025214mg [Xenopus laevis]